MLLFLGLAGIAPEVSTQWKLVSTDLNFDGINGAPLLEAPFNGYYLNFNAGAINSSGIDSDGDGLLDSIEDTNGNGIVDAGETDPFNSDTDGDGATDGQEDINANGLIDIGESNPLNVDTDNDGLLDGYEINIAGTDPTVITTVYTPATLPLTGDMNDDSVLNTGDILLLQVSRPLTT